MLQIHTDADLTNILWYKLGGTAKYLLQVSSEQDVLDALAFVKDKDIKNIFICGTGANLIFTHEYYDGALIQFVHGEQEQIATRDTTIIEAFSGELLDHVITYGFDRNLIGLEWAGGLPGTVGAAVRGNVGAYGGELKDTFLQAKILVKDANGSYTIKTIEHKDMNFVYRGSVVKEQGGEMIVLSTSFALKQATDEETQKARAVYESKIQHRKDHHPLEYPNCGSVFKNIREPEKVQKVLQHFPDLEEYVQTKWYGKVAAAHLIHHKLGLKGFRVGNAQISDKHALFIINLGGAKPADVLKIIDTIQQKFQDTFGFTLEPEVEIVQ